jgi:hypothetical protein
MKATRILASLILVTAMAGAAQAQLIHCGWNSCDSNPNVNHTDPPHVAPGTYNFVVSIIGADAPLIGTSMLIDIYPGVPDAWRFDAGGCQGPDYVAFSSSSFSKTCPTLRGTNPLPVPFYGYDPGTQRANIALFNSHDTFDPTPAQRYSIWVVSFDHQYSVPGPGVPGSTCGGKEVPLALELKNIAYNRADGNVDRPQGDTYCTWNQGPVATEKSTMGRVKAQYR